MKQVHQFELPIPMYGNQHVIFPDKRQMEYNLITKLNWLLLELVWFVNVKILIGTLRIKQIQVAANGDYI